MDIGVDGSIVLLVLTVLLVSTSRELVVNSLTQLSVTTKLLPTLTTLVIDGTFIVGAHLVAAWFVLKTPLCVGLTIEGLVVEFACFDSISGSFQYEGFLESFLHYFI